MTGPIRLELVYAILVDVANRQTQITYRELSEAYQRRTGQRFPAQTTWDEALNEMNRLLYDAGLPALAAVVVEGTKEPSAAFWESCASVPKRPSLGDARKKTLTEIVLKVYGTKWPDSLPVGEPDEPAAP